MPFRAFSRLISQCLIPTVTYLIYLQAGSPTGIAQEVLHAGYWENTPQTRSEIGLHNNKAWDIAAKLRLYSAGGELVAEQELLLPSTSMKILDLDSMLSSSRGGGVGRAEIEFKGKPKDVIGQVVIRDRRKGDVANAGLFLLAPFATDQYEVLAPPASQYQRRTLALSNTSIGVMHVLAEIYCGDVSEPQRARYAIEAGAMQVVELGRMAESEKPGIRCPASAPSRLLLKHDGPPGTMGLTLLNRARSGPLFFSKVVNAKKFRGDSFILPYFDTGADWNGVFTLANRTPQPQTIAVEVLPEAGDFASYREIESITLKPYEVIHQTTKRLLPANSASSGPVALRFRLPNSTNAISDSPFLVDLVQRNRKLGIFLHTEPKNPETDRSAGFSQPWQVGGGAETIIALMNPSLTDEVPWMATVHVGVRKLSSMSEHPLKPLEVKYLRLSDLLAADADVAAEIEAESKPDQTLSGFIQVSVQPSVGQRRFLLSQSVIMDGRQGMGMVSSCMTCPPSAWGYSVSPLTFVGNVGQTFPLTPLCHLDNGTQQTIFNPFALSWSPTTSGIAGVTSTWSSNTLSLLGPGTTTIGSQANDCVYEYDHSLDECNCSGTPFDVQQEVQVSSECILRVNTVAGNRLAPDQGDVGFTITNLNCPGGGTNTVTVAMASSGGSGVIVSGTGWEGDNNTNQRTIPMPSPGGTSQPVQTKYAVSGTGTLIMRAEIILCNGTACSVLKWKPDPKFKDSAPISFYR